MQYFPKTKAVVALVVLGLILLAFMLSVTTNTITNVSAVETEGVSVWWDTSCTNRTLSINWGTLNPGAVKSIVAYIRNDAMEAMYLTMSTENWYPKESYYITFGWDYTARRIDPREVLPTKLILSISRSIKGISNFRFDIVIVGSKNLPGDVNGDGNMTSTDITILNALLTKIMLHKMTLEEALAQYSLADVNGDGEITSTDMSIPESLLAKIMFPS